MTRPQRVTCIDGKIKKMGAANHTPIAKQRALLRHRSMRNYRSVSNYGVELPRSITKKR